MAIGGPGNSALRSLVSVNGARELLEDDHVRDAASAMSLGATQPVQQARGHGHRAGRVGGQLLARRAAPTASMVAFRASSTRTSTLLDQLVAEPDTALWAEKIAERFDEAVSLRTAAQTFTDIQTVDGQIEFTSRRTRSHFAVRFGRGVAEDDSSMLREGQARAAFNSPFWPFVLATTSVGQEGLDFHPYCHAVVHWNLPTNPVDLEQREGRVHRYKGHAVRKNVAAVYGGRREVATSSSPLGTLFNLASARPPRRDQRDLPVVDPPS